MGRIKLKIFFFIILVIYAGIRYQHFNSILPKIKQTDDTPSYVRASKSPFWSADAQIRAPTYPFLITLSSGDLRITAYLQAFLSVIAWGWLAWAVSQNFRTILFSLTAFFTILVFSLDKHIIGWDTVIQTESLSISLMFLLVGLWLMPGKKNSLIFSLLIFTGALWAFTRDTNAYILLAFGLVIPIAVIQRKLSKEHVIITVGLVCVFTLSSISFNIGNRWVYSFQNMLGKRILNNSQAVEFFLKCGMPKDNNLLALANARNTTINPILSRNPDFENYRAWRDANGRNCYLRWLLFNPIQTLAAPINNMNTIMQFNEIDRFFVNKFKAILPPLIADIIYPNNNALIIFCVSIVLQIYGLFFVKKSNKSIWAFLLIGNILLYPHLFLIYHGDTNDTPRHAMTAAAQLFIFFWITLILIIEHLGQIAKRLLLKGKVYKPVEFLFREY